MKSISEIKKIIADGTGIYKVSNKGLISVDTMGIYNMDNILKGVEEIRKNNKADIPILSYHFYIRYDLTKYEIGSELYSMSLLDFIKSNYSRFDQEYLYKFHKYMRELSTWKSFRRRKIYVKYKDLNSLKILKDGRLVIFEKSLNLESRILKDVLDKILDDINIMLMSYKHDDFERILMDSNVLNLLIEERLGKKILDNSNFFYSSSS